jgi:hypothetical protein
MKTGQNDIVWKTDGTDMTQLQNGAAPFKMGCMVGHPFKTGCVVTLIISAFVHVQVLLHTLIWVCSNLGSWQARGLKELIFS